MNEDVSIASTADLVDFFDRAGLLDKGDADKIRDAFRKLGFRKDVFHKRDGSWTGGNMDSKKDRKYATRRRAGRSCSKWHVDT